VQATQQQYLKTKNEQLPLPANAMSLVVTELAIIAATIWPDPKISKDEAGRTPQIIFDSLSLEFQRNIRIDPPGSSRTHLGGFIWAYSVDTLLSKFQVSLQTWL